MFNYTREQLWQIYRELPKNLKELIFSEEVSAVIRNISSRNKLENVEKLAEIVGYVLLGLLPPHKLESVLISQLSIDKEKGEQVSFEVERFILSQVKKELGDLYKKEDYIPKEEEKKEDLYKEKIE